MATTSTPSREPFTPWAGTSASTWTLVAGTDVYTSDGSSIYHSTNGIDFTEIDLPNAAWLQWKAVELDGAWYTVAYGVSGQFERSLVRLDGPNLVPVPGTVGAMENEIAVLGDAIYYLVRRHVLPRRAW